MSFNFNPIGKNLSNIQASAKSQDGGAGNTGYFARQNEEDEVKLEFSRDYENDKFIKEDETIEEKSFLDFIIDFIGKILDAIAAVFTKK